MQNWFVCFLSFATWLWNLITILSDFFFCCCGQIICSLTATNVLCCFVDWLIILLFFVLFLHKMKKKPWFLFLCILILLLHLWSHIKCANIKRVIFQRNEFRDHCFARMLCLCFFYLNYKLNLNVIVCVLGCCLLSVLHIQMLPLTMFLWSGSYARFNVNSHDSEISAEIV